MPGRDLEAIAELRIREAQRRGELDDLPGTGQPLDLNDLAGLSRSERIEALLLRSLGEVPEEVKLLRQLSEMSEQIDRTEDDAGREQLRAERHALAVRLSVLFEKAGRNLSAKDVVDRFG